MYVQGLSVQAQYRSFSVLSSPRYNGSLVVTRTVVCLIAAKFKLHIFPVLRFALSNVANIRIFMIFYDCCLLRRLSTDFTHLYLFLSTAASVVSLVLQEQPSFRTARLLSLSVSLVTKWVVKLKAEKLCS
jgi:hypothetical protein